MIVADLHVPVFVVAQTQPTEETYPRRVRVRYSGPAFGMRGWTSDNLPRQKSNDYVSMKDYGAKIGLPDQIKYMPDVWVTLPEKRQRWLFDVLCLSAYGKVAGGLTANQFREAKSEWAEYLDDGRCFTNRTGTTTHHDYINNTNTGADLMRWEPLLTGGNWVELTGRVKSISTSYLNFGVHSYSHYEARAINVNALPTPETFLLDDCVCHVPTTIQPSGQTGIFPQWGEKARYPLWSTSNSVWIWSQLLEL